MGIPVLIAEGGNGLRIPCRLFDCTLEEAKGRMKKILGPPSVDHDGKVAWRIEREEDGKFEIVTPELAAARCAARKFADDNNNDREENWRDLMHQEFNRLGGHSLKDGELIDPEAIFTGYYGGCGECGGFVLMEIEPDTVFVRWDLD